MIKLTLIATCLIGVALAAQPGYSPARYTAGAKSSLPAITEAMGGGQAIVELLIDPSGGVTKATPLRTTPPFSALVANVVGGWRFTPAEDDKFDGVKPAGRESVPSRVLVAALYRAPTLQTPTLGEPPKDVASASAEVAFPTSIAEPPYPVLARSGGVVMIEVRVDGTGTVVDARVIGSAPPFDASALDAARRWRFRPARVGGRPAATYVYLIFGFPEPITG